MAGLIPEVAMCTSQSSFVIDRRGCAVRHTSPIDFDSFHFDRRRRKGRQFLALIFSKTDPPACRPGEWMADPKRFLDRAALC